jgi:hypothetical protein
MTYQNIIQKIITLSRINKMSQIVTNLMSPQLAFEVFLDNDVTRKDGSIFFKLISKIINDFRLAYRLILSNIIDKSDGTLYDLALKNALKDPEQSRTLLEKHLITPDDTKV